MNFEATEAWRYHFGILGYFFSETNPPSTTDPAPRVPVGGPPEGALGLQNYMYFFLPTPGENGKWREDQEEAGPNYLYEVFRDDGLAELETGDYCFHYLGTNRSSHGFIIVGWGDAVEADTGLNADRLNTQAIMTTRPRNSQTQAPLDSIPYVADFVYGYSNGAVGWLQDPRPRPFYASLTELNTTQLSNIADRLGYSSSNFQQEYLGRLQQGTYGRFEANPLEFSGGVPIGWLFYHFPSRLDIAFPTLFESPVEGSCS